jgi:hypothetical protein
VGKEVVETNILRGGQPVAADPLCNAKRVSSQPELVVVEEVCGCH